MILLLGSPPHALPYIVMLGERENEATSEELTSDDILCTVGVDAGAAFEEVSGDFVASDYHSVLASDVDVV